MTARAPWIAAVLLVVAAVDVATSDAEGAALRAAAAAVMIVPLALLARSVWPAVAGCVLGPVLAGVAGEEIILPCIFALQLTGFALADRMAGRGAALAAAAIALGLGVHLATIEGLGDIVYVLGAFFVPFLVAGRVVRDRRRQIAELRATQEALAEERDHVVRLATEAERASIARDLEAVLAATVRSIEADLARAPDPPTAETFEALHRRGSEAMSELRRLLGVLHSGGGTGGNGNGARALAERPAQDHVGAR